MAFPQPFVSTVSHWQATNRGPDTLYDHGRTVPLPKDEVDYVIIGAGMAGVSLAYALTREDLPRSKVVVLEAKDIASGASGRNGGHVAPWSFKHWAEVIKPLKDGGAGISHEEGLAVLEQERQNLNYVTEVVKKEGWAVDFWRGEKVEAVISKYAAQEMRESYKAWLKAHHNSPKFRDTKPDWEYIDDPREAQRISRVKGALGISKGAAGSIHPHKLATHFLRSALDSGNCEFYSWCPVESFAQTGEDKWSVNCGRRGIIKTKKVIVCTNAHTRYLFKGEAIDKHLTPYSTQAVNVTPPPTFAGKNALGYTLTAENGPYLMSTPHSGIVLGLYPEHACELSNDKRAVIEVIDDSYVKEEHQAWLRSWCKDNFIGWGKEAPGEGAVRYWSGITCFSRDLLPLAGEVPGRPGLFLSVGFHGHGMGRIPHLSKCLAKTLTTGKWDEDIPTSYKITDERLARAQEAPPFVTQEELDGKPGPKGFVRGQATVEPKAKL